MELGLIHLGRTALYCLYMGETIWSNSYFIDFFGFIIYQTRSKEVGGCFQNCKERISRTDSYRHTILRWDHSENIVQLSISFPHPISRDMCEGRFSFLPSSNQINSLHPYSHGFLRNFLGRVSTILFSYDMDKMDEIYFLSAQLDIKEFGRL